MKEDQGIFFSRAGYAIDAPCKINLHLRIMGKRLDGFHDLESIFLALDFGDTLFFELGGEDGSCDIEILDESIPVRIEPDKNLIVKAVSLFRSVTAFTPGVRIRLLKRIPLGGGLGGGSSDAASTLIAMQRLSGVELPQYTLDRMAGDLGSDVPFFFKRGAAIVRGRGDLLKPIPMPRQLWFVLVCPDFASNTAAAFRLLNRRRYIEPAKSGVLEDEQLVKALGNEPEMWPFVNDFLPVFLNAGPPDTAAAYRSMLEDLKKTGAVFSGLSGSGSVCFGVFTDKETAEIAAGTLERRWNFVRLSFFLAC
ncbi:MAG: 4-(cytidine 5'-diphospho)-2-C-methyl-D-erythritol kinase [Treponema sp.]|jgi:4-diphosphocytidyl-2-C-methyl-D-erythritol kinase|nr:4-(cytidine 5'-diphospho)-2-C-methyl-D-erythritol kinase [Treponema sp.]